LQGVGDTSGAGYDQHSGGPERKTGNTGSSVGGNRRNENVNPNKKSRGINKKGSPVLPVTQGLTEGGAKGSCTVVSSIPALSECQDRNSECWSVGQADVDCLDNALCCFDGCANVCQGRGAHPNIPRPQTNARGQKRKTGKRNQQSQKVAKNGERIQSDKERGASVQQNKFQPQPSQKPSKKQKGDKINSYDQPRDQSIANSKTQESQSPFVKGVGGGLLFPPVSKENEENKNVRRECPGFNKQKLMPGNHEDKPVNSQKPSRTFVPPAQVQPAEHKSQPRRPKPSNFQQSLAASKPYIRCPSAMKCVQKVNCDFEGLITEEVLDLSPQLETLRVPLIPCVNRGRGNAVDVCCRDPSYTGPPNTQGGNTPNTQGGNTPNTQGGNTPNTQGGNTPNRTQQGTQSTGQQPRQEEAAWQQDDRGRSEEAGLQSKKQKRKKSNAYG